MARVELVRDVQGSVGVAWAVVSDVLDYANVAPNIERAEVFGGRGLGMERRCFDHRGNGWSERCVDWSEGAGYAMEVDTREYPEPFGHLVGSWHVERAAHGARIRMAFDYDFVGRGPFGRISGRWLAGPRLTEVCEVVLHRWAEMIRVLAVEACG
jgi:hypothetical protein